MRKLSVIRVFIQTFKLQLDSEFGKFTFLGVFIDPLPPLLLFSSPANAVVHTRFIDVDAVWKT